VFDWKHLRVEGGIRKISRGSPRRGAGREIRVEKFFASAEARNVLDRIHSKTVARRREVGLSAFSAENDG